MTIKQVARHRAIDSAPAAASPTGAAPATTPGSAQGAARPHHKHRAGLPTTMLTGVLALVVLLALAIVVLGVVVR